MTRVALRALWGRKLRTFLTGFAIVLGVATVSGTFVLTDSISSAFDNIFSSIYQNTDAAITGKSAVSSSSNTEQPPFSESLLAKVKDLPGVAAGVGGVGGEANLIKDGKVIGFGTAPHLGFSVDPTQPKFSSLTLTKGSWPTANEVVIDQSTAGKKHIEVGDTIGVEAESHTLPMRVSGLVKFGAVSSIGGATLSGFDLTTSQRLFRKVGKLDQIRVSAKSGVSESELLGIAVNRRPEIRRRLPVAGGRERHEGLHQLPAEVPARLRRDRAVRGRIRDRELALDHDRPAHA